MVKDGVAWSAFAAMCGVLQAVDGFTSAPSLFGAPEAADLVASLGRDWLIERLYFKPYCCCRWAQPAVRAALAVSARHGVRAAEIRSIRVETFAEACSLTRKIPTTTEEAQYSVAWPVAAALLYGDVGPDQVLEHALADPACIGLMQKVTFQHRPDFQAQFPARRFAEVYVDAGDEVFSSGPVSAHGDPDDPLSDGEIEAKFQRYAGQVFDETSRLGMISRIWSMGS
jgi:2-methylcitrate dehydratase PrpD